MEREDRQGGEDKPLPLLWREASMEIFVLVRNESGVSKKMTAQSKIFPESKTFYFCKRACDCKQETVSNRHPTELVVLGAGSWASL